MKNKFFFLVKNSLDKKMKSKWFVIANIILLLAIVAVGNIDNIINFIGGDFNKKTKIYIIDETKTSGETFKNNLLVASGKKEFKDLNYELVEKDNLDDDGIKKLVKDNDKDIVIKLYLGADKMLASKIITYKYMDLADSQIINNAIYNTKVMIALSHSDINPVLLDSIYGDADITRVIIDETKKSENESMEIIMTTAFPVVILPVFMLIIFLVQMIGAEINEEKTTRGMEIIISSVSPRIHFFSKILASNLFVLIQGLMLVIYSGIAFYVRTLFGNKVSVVGNDSINEVINIIKKTVNADFISKLGTIIPILLVLIILTFLAYSMIAGILASMTTNVEDYQQIQTPIMLVLLLGYYLSMLAGQFDGSILIKVLSYVPLISAILSPSLLVLGQIGLIDVFISVALLIVFNLVIIKYGFKIYKVGILNYSSTKLWKKMGKALKSK